MNGQTVSIKQAMMLGFFGAVGAVAFYGTVAAVAWLVAPKQTQAIAQARTTTKTGGCGCGGA
jgi:hypothetical protein